MLGKQILTSRGIDLKDLSVDGFLRWGCPCGFSLSGPIEDNAFTFHIYKHVEICKLARGGIGVYPVELKNEEGLCPECVNHIQISNGGRCKNYFINNNKHKSGKCECKSFVHPKILRGDTSARSR